LLYYGFKKHILTHHYYGRPVHDTTQPFTMCTANDVKCFTERRQTSCVRQCGYKIRCDNYSHL